MLMFTNKEFLNNPQMKIMVIEAYLDNRLDDFNDPMNIKSMVAPQRSIEDVPMVGFN